MKASLLLLAAIAAPSWRPLSFPTQLLALFGHGATPDLVGACLQLGDSQINYGSSGNRVGDFERS
jgi:hypothetical protein